MEKGYSFRDSIELPSNLRYVKEGSSFVLDKLGRLNLDESMLYDIRFSIEEALINAMKYGNGLIEKKKVKLSFTAFKDKVEIVIEDSGEGFDYKNLPDPTKDEQAITKYSGRGIFLMRHLMDEVSFNEKGNIVKMVKSFQMKPRLMERQQT